jgi:hypothetical protein
VTTLTPRRLVAETVPVAAVLLFWVVVSWIAPLPTVSSGLRLAGVVMALLYVGVRGASLARTTPVATQPVAVAGVVRENARVLLAAGTWFLAAGVLQALDPLWDLAGLPGAFTSPADSLAFVATGTGVAAVVLYAVAVGVARVRGDASSDRPESDAFGTES